MRKVADCIGDLECCSYFLSGGDRVLVSWSKCMILYDSLIIAIVEGLEKGNGTVARYCLRLRLGDCNTLGSITLIPPKVSYVGE